MLKRSRSKSKRFFGLLLWRRLNAYDWYQRLLSIGIISLYGVFTLPSMTIAIAPNAQLQNWRFSPEFGQLEFTLSAASQPKVFFLSQPARLVVDLPGTKLGFVPTQQNYSGAIQRIRLSQLNANVTRIVLDLAPGTTINPSQVLVQPTSPTSWVLRPFITSYTNNFQPGINSPQPINNFQPGINPPQPINNFQPGINPPQPINNFQPGINPPQPMNNFQPGISAPQPINNFQPVINPPQSPGLVTQPVTIPSTNNNTQQQQQPFVSVPPLTTNNSSQMPGLMLPPATFPNPVGGVVNTPPLIVPNYNVPTTVQTTVPTDPSNPISNTNPGVVPWGQSLPSQR